MTEKEMQEIVQQQNDKIQLLRDQCTSAENQFVNAGAANMALQRKIAELDATLVERANRIAELEAQVPAPKASKPNGKSENHAAA